MRARVLRGQAREGEARFAETFTVGRGAECDLQLLEPAVSLRHLQVVFDGRLWWVRDLDSDGGTYLDGTRIQVVPLRDEAVFELGEGGPSLSLASVKEETDGFTSETQILRRYLRRAEGGPVGRETAMFQRAFARVQRRSSRRYQAVLALVLLALVAAGSVIAYQARKLAALRGTAERLFYATKSVELQVSKLEGVVLLHEDRKLAAELVERRSQLKEMEKQYDDFVRELRVYAKVPEDERVMLRVGRAFGECEINVPDGFVPEVRRYVERWRSTDRLRKSLARAARGGYAPTIARIFTERNLPPEYIYLALQESAFDERAVGPLTRYGFAKGMWQFIGLTAHRYGLRIGPLYEEGVYDPDDERFDWQKATAAASAYLRDLQATDAQGSGLLAMACYNWGQENVRTIIDRLPENPLERNFWRLLRDRSVPRETYDYVLSIFSAAVICEDPRLFGFDVECPLRGPASEAAGVARGGSTGAWRR